MDPEGHGPGDHGDDGQPPGDGSRVTSSNVVRVTPTAEPTTRRTLRRRVTAASGRPMKSAASGIQNPSVVLSSR